MLTVMLVAGGDTNSLKSFLEDRGTLEVIHSYNSLSGNETKLSSTLLNPDKFVYVSGKDNPNLLRDMQVLKELLTGDSYFSPREIQFFTVIEEGSTNFCDITMQQVARIAEKKSSVVVPEYIVNETTKDVSFEHIYSIIMGTVEPIDADVGMDFVYMYERSNSSRRAYEEDESPSRAFEPFSYKRLDLYERTKEGVARTDSGELFYDEEEKFIPKTDPDFGNLYLHPTTKKLCLMFTGNHKSGVSTMASAMGISLLSKFDKVLLVDFSHSQNASDILTVGNVPHNLVGIKDILSRESVSFDKGLSILSCNIPSMYLYLARNITVNLSRLECDVIIFDVSRDRFRQVLKTVETLYPKSFVMSGTTRSEINSVRELFIGEGRFDLILSKFNESIGMKLPDIDVSDIRYTVPNVKHIVAPIVFENFVLDGYLAESLLSEE